MQFHSDFRLIVFAAVLVASIGGLDTEARADGDSNNNNILTELENGQVDLEREDPVAGRHGQGKFRIRPDAGRGDSGRDAGAA